MIVFNYQPGEEMKRIVILSAVFLLSGCITPEQQFNQDKSYCEKFGYHKGTEKYADCLKEFHMQRDKIEQQSDSRMMNDFMFK